MNNEYIFIVRCGEVALKGMNKPYFERMLLDRIKKLLKKFDGVKAYRHEGLIYVRADKSLDKQAIIHCPVGKKSFTAEQLTENLNALMSAIVRAKPAAAKGTYLRSVVLSSTMGPGIKINGLKF